MNEPKPSADTAGQRSSPPPDSAFDEIAVESALRRIRATQNVEDPTGRYQYPDCADVLAAEVERLRAVCEKQQWRIASLQQDMRTIITVTRWEHQAHQIAKRALTPNDRTELSARVTPTAHNNHKI